MNNNKRFKKIYADIIVANAVVTIFSIVLWLKFYEPIGGLLVPITIWISWMYVKISKADRYLSEGIDILKSIK